MPDTPHHPRIDLQEVDFRNHTARRIVAGFSTVTPTLADIWRYIDAALADAPALSAEIGRLRAEIADTRLDRANLAAAARATIAAYHDGEPDPLSYVRDELRAQGHETNGGHA